MATGESGVGVGGQMPPGEATLLWPKTQPRAIPKKLVGLEFTRLLAAWHITWFHWAYADQGDFRAWGQQWVYTILLQPQGSFVFLQRHSNQCSPSELFSPTCLQTIPALQQIGSAGIAPQRQQL